jgi:hypothetical protein
LLEGGERRPDEDTFWYPDLQRMARSRQFAESYSAPADEPGDPAQCVHVSQVRPWQFQRDGGQRDAEDVVIYPEAGLRREHGVLLPSPGTIKT